MVNKAHHACALVLVSMFLLVSTASVLGWSGAYHIDQEWIKLWINHDGSIELFYNISLTLDSGQPIKTVYVGQPNQYFTTVNATDQYGHSLLTNNVISADDYKVGVTLNSQLMPEQTTWFTLTTVVTNMIYNDTMNPGNVGMQFVPTWWSVAELTDLRLSIVLPLGITEEMVRQGQVKTSIDWMNVLSDNDQVALYWERQNLPPDARFTVGVSFSAQYVDTSSLGPPPESNPTFSVPPYLMIFPFAVVIVMVVVVVALVMAKKPYAAPSLRMETLGVRRGLTAVEASYLLDLKPTQIVTEMLYSLLQKRAVWVESADPEIKIMIMPSFKNLKASPEVPIRYYEIDFLNAVKPDGGIDEIKLARTVMTLRDAVEEKMRGYCRRDTLSYYKNVVVKAWQQVEQAGTPDLASRAYDEQLLWLLLDPDIKTRTQTVFQNRAFEPAPLWFWYWYGYRQYHPNPVYAPNIQAPAQSAKPPTILGADFANNIATAVEKTSNNIVVNIEKFANAIVPMSAKAESQPVHHNATCVCACHACACACACVSCACACAGGGVG